MEKKYKYLIKKGEKMRIEESFNDNHLICIELSKDDIKQITNKKSKYYGGCVQIKPPKSEEIQILISVEK